MRQRAAEKSYVEPQSDDEMLAEEEEDQGYQSAQTPQSQDEKKRNDDVSDLAALATAAGELPSSSSPVVDGRKTPRRVDNDEVIVRNSLQLCCFLQK